MDVSTLFRACVKTVNLRKEALSEEIPRVPPRKQKPESMFRAKTKSLVTQISKLQQFLLEKRSAYLNLSKHLALSNSMTDAERDEIDNVSQEIMTTCSGLIKDLERDTAQADISQQNREHRMATLDLIKHYLENVCKIYSEQRAIRYKKMMELKKLSKLELEKSSEAILHPPRKELEHDKRDVSPSAGSSPLKVQEMNGDVSPVIYEEELSAEDIQMFESENEQLYNELNTITEEVRLIESKVVHIAELQEIFTEKVLQQDRDLDKLVTTVVGSTENVKEANEQIRQAIQRNAGLRVWILFFLLVMSFSLLFLDWYNP
ncbi:syntaxin-18 [Fopius arisanus]|uniref:Syntaxin-18 n=1 Tax=Fopius arisanus TaxID=64838 RepID=A0A9R1T473_9HYME|nr:PREDICTED: syntaxin-18 [Fopius arisanus]